MTTEVEKCLCGQTLPPGKLRRNCKRPHEVVIEVGSIVCRHPICQPCYVQARKSDRKLAQAQEALRQLVKKTGEHEFIQKPDMEDYYREVRRW